MRSSRPKRPPRRPDVRPFQYERPASPERARASGDRSGGRRESAPTAGSQFIAAGTTIVDLMKLDVAKPAVLVDVNAVPRDEMRRIEVAKGGASGEPPGDQIELSGH